MVTLVEFLAPVQKAGNRDKILATLYFAAHHEQLSGLTVDQLRTRLKQARIAKAAKINIADVLAKAGHYADAPEVNSKGARLWQLTESGDDYVRDLLDLPKSVPQLEHDVEELAGLARGIADDVIRGYIDEA